MKIAIAVVAWLGVSSAVGALFPTPLHLVRRVEDPISHTTTTLDEYCSGDRIVTVSGSRVAIADYGVQRLTEIDHARATWSVTRFDDIARARPRIPATKTESKMKIEVDRSVTLSREAVEALVGAAYPNRRVEQHDEILRAAAPPGGHVAVQSIGAEAQYGLPSDTSVTFENGLIYRSVVIHVDHDSVPAQLMLIDPGATRVESRLTRTARELQQLDAPPKR